MAKLSKHFNEKEMIKAFCGGEYFGYSYIEQFIDNQEMLYKLQEIKDLTWEVLENYDWDNYVEIKQKFLLELGLDYKELYQKYAPYI